VCPPNKGLAQNSPAKKTTKNLIRAIEGANSGIPQEPWVRGQTRFLSGFCWGSRHFIVSASAFGVGLLGYSLCVGSYDVVQDIRASPPKKNKTMNSSEEDFSSMFIFSSLSSEIPIIALPFHSIAVPGEISIILTGRI